MPSPNVYPQRYDTRVRTIVTLTVAEIAVYKVSPAPLKQPMYTTWLIWNITIIMITLIIPTP